MYPSLINKKIPLNDLVCGEYYPPSQSFVYGNITMPTNVGALSYELKEGLTNFFNNHDFGLFTCFSYTTAVMKVNNDYWIFDSHARDAQGMINEKGKAVLIQFVSVDEIVQYLRDLYGVNKQYEVYVVTGKIVKSVSVKKQATSSVNVGSMPQHPKSSLSVGFPLDQSNRIHILGASSVRPEKSFLVGASSSERPEKSSLVGASSFERPEKSALVGASSFERPEKFCLLGASSSERPEKYVFVDTFLPERPEDSVSVGLSCERPDKNKCDTKKTENLNKKEKRKLLLQNARKAKQIKLSDESCTKNCNNTLELPKNVGTLQLHDTHKGIRCTRSGASIIQTSEKLPNNRKEYFQEQYQFNDVRRKQVQKYSREHHQQCSDNSHYKANKLNNTKRKLENDDEYKKRNLSNVKARLENDDEYRKRNLQNVKARLQNDDEYRQRNLQNVKDRLKNDEQYKNNNLENAIERYQTKIQTNEIKYEQFLVNSRNSKKKTERNTTDDQKRQKLYEQYYNSLKEGPSHVCVCCSQIYFKKSVNEYDIQSA